MARKEANRFYFLREIIKKQVNNEHKKLKLFKAKDCISNSHCL